MPSGVDLTGLAAPAGQAEIPAERTQRFVKAELKRADMTYEELAAKLREMGLQETKISIASKLSRAGFSESFFLAVMKAIGRETVNLGEL